MSVDNVMTNGTEEKIFKFILFYVFFQSDAPRDVRCCSIDGYISTTGSIVCLMWFWLMEVK